MPFNLIDKQVIFAGKKVRLEVHHLQNEEGKRHQAEVVVHPGAVVVLPFLGAEEILLIRNRRYAIGQILLELPAGTLDGKENPMNAAGRELLEETGYVASRLKPLINFYSSPGILSEKMYAFAAYDLEPSHQALEVGEEIELVPTMLDEALNMVQLNQIQDGKTITALLMYDRFFRNAH